jgi:hypothetical protein
MWWKYLGSFVDIIARANSTSYADKSFTIRKKISLSKWEKR